MNEEIKPNPTPPAPSKPITDPMGPPQDLSPRVVELARRLDRLPPGIYELSISKPDIRALEWSGEIRELNRGVVEVFNLPKRSTLYRPE